MLKPEPAASPGRGSNETRRAPSALVREDQRVNGAPGGSARPGRSLAGRFGGRDRVGRAGVRGRRGRFRLLWVAAETGG